LRIHLSISNLRGDRRAALRPHPYQRMASQRVARRFCGLRHWPTHA
jgi:hypothetical protein